MSLFPGRSAKSLCGNSLTERQLELAKQKNILLHGTNACIRETPEPRKGRNCYPNRAPQTN